MTIDLSTCPRAVADVAVEDQPDGQRLLRPAEGQTLLLNATAYALWQLCDGRTTVQEMGEGITELFGLQPAEATAEVERTLGELGRAGLLEETPVEEPS